MEQQIYNPFLPLWEYVPDGEVHQFGDRVYMYGSHDRFGAPLFCLNDYVCWSAPIDNLKEWQLEGVIYKKKQDPKNKFGLRLMFAPDVVQGNDGKYYLYYALDFLGMMSVAVCDEPAGKFEFLGHVKFQDGHSWGTKAGEPFPFDPAVIVDDDGRVYLFSGFATKVPAIATRNKKLTNEGGVMLELAQDMTTIISEPILLFPRKDRPGAYPNHAFFEASSIRKYDGIYYFVYSSEHNHELCYATSTKIGGPYDFQGTLVSIGDLFLASNTNEQKATNYLGNTHGSVLKVGDDWYVFYHRQTNLHSYSRQMCAEQLSIDDSGKLLQSEVTSCGLNKQPLKGEGKYPAAIACNLWGKNGATRYDIPLSRIRLRKEPYFTQKNNDKAEKESQYIANMRDGSVAGFKYFTLNALEKIEVVISGKGQGKFEVAVDEAFTNKVCEIEVLVNAKKAQNFGSKTSTFSGEYPLYFRYRGSGFVDFYSLTLSK